MSAGRSRSGGRCRLTTFRRNSRSSRKRPAATSASQVAVAGGDQAHVDLDRAGAADPVDLALLDRAQQLGLQAGVHLADLVEQQRAAARLLELADPPGGRAGEGALLVAEQLGFQQVLRDRGAVDRDERPFRAAAVAMHVACEHLLAGAALAGDQHAGVRGRDLARHGQQIAHRRILEHQLAPFVADRGEDRGDQLRVRRQRQELPGAGLDRGDRGAGDRCRRRRRPPARRSAPRRARRSAARCRPRHRPAAGRRRDRRSSSCTAASGVATCRSVAPCRTAIPMALATCSLFAPTISTLIATSSLLRSFAHSRLGLDDLGHGHAQTVVDDHDLAARDQAVVDQDVDRLRRPCGPARPRRRGRAAAAG